MAYVFLWLQIFGCFFLGCSHISIGVLGPWVELGDLLLAAMSADIDFRPSLKVHFCFTADSADCHNVDIG